MATDNQRNGEAWFPPHKSDDGSGLQVVRGYDNKPGWGEPLNVRDHHDSIELLH